MYDSKYGNKSLTQYPVIVIGGGAAGMIAAWQASYGGVPVLLLEKNAKLGIKILISGGGKCNITHSGTMEDLRKQFKMKEARFLKYSFRTFTNAGILDLLHDRGVETYERENGKIFPTSHKAGEVVHALRQVVESSGVEIRLSSPVRSIQRDESGIFKVSTDKEQVEAETVIVSVGGTSYQKTGTTGDGYEWARSIGHTIVPLRPALAPLYTQPVPPQEWQGTPIRDCMMMVHSNDVRIAQWRGDVLFTHTGMSGPAVLEVSRDAYIEFEKGHDVSVSIDFVPDISVEEMEQAIIGETTRNGNRLVQTIAGNYVPQKLSHHVVRQAAIDTTKKLVYLTKAERKSLIHTFKKCRFGLITDIPLDRGEVTAGGIELGEVDPTTMESKIVPGLFFCGEILDIAGPVGGYNLQAAFSTGYVAGKYIARRFKEHRSTLD